MNLKNQISLLGSQIKHWLVVWIIASLIFSAVYAFTTPLPQVTTWDSLTAELWNNMTDAVNNEYLTNWTEVLTNKTWDWQPVYRRVFSVDPNEWLTTLWTIAGAYPIWNWSLLSNSTEYQHWDPTHSNYTVYFSYDTTTDLLQVHQTWWTDSTWSEATFVFEYIKN